jgi:hypothetical protein
MKNTTIRGIPVRLLAALLWLVAVAVFAVAIITAAEGPYPPQGTTTGITP